MEHAFKEKFKQLTAQEHYELSILFYKAVKQLYVRKDYESLSLQEKWEINHKFIEENTTNEKFLQFSPVELLNITVIHSQGLSWGYTESMHHQNAKAKYNPPVPTIWTYAKMHIDEIIDAYEMQTFENYKF